MGGKDLGFDVVYRGQTRQWIAPGKHVFFQRLKEHGGGYWLGQIYDDWFGFLIDEPISLRQGMDYLMTIRSQEKDIIKFDDSIDTFMLNGE